MPVCVEVQWMCVSGRAEGLLEIGCATIGVAGRADVCVCVRQKHESLTHICRNYYYIMQHH